MTHEDATHGPAPMGRVDTEPMHRAVDALAAALHDYVGTAVGVRAEFGAAEADEDPRVLALESKVGHLNAALFDTLHSSLGMHPDLTSSVWEPEDGADPDEIIESELPEGGESFYLGFVVAARGGDASLDGVIDLLDAAGESVATHLTEGGYDIAEWAASRGEAPGFGFYEEDDE
ncbi:hypothetical protein ACFO6V_19385 [Promicromonospora alba]|jgi:hypothetical protein|uniref:Uncharacterized protein n=1 Tax=Promicromonospora alba TaxID=1616110 RepID=A0ABV9HJJ2_9MICO